MHPRRTYTRHPISLKVEVNSAVGWTAAETVDISRNGLFLRVPPGMEAAPVLQLRVHLPGGDPVVVLGRVTRKVGGVLNPGDVPGLGIELMSMAVAHRKRWDDFVIEQSRHSPQMSQVSSARPRRSAATGTEESVLPSGLSRSDATIGRTPPTRGVSGRPPPPRRNSGPGRADRIGPPLAGRSGSASEPDLTVPPMRPPTPPRSVVPPRAPTPPRAQPNAFDDELTDYGRGPATTADTDPKSTVLRVRPATRARLAALIERRTGAGELYLRPDIDVVAGERVSLVLVHHESDAELPLPAVVDRIIPGRPGTRPGVLLAFPPAVDADARSLQEFLDHGMPPAKPADPVEVRADADRIKALRRAALERPEDARRWIRLGWELLLAGEPVEATMPLQRGMTLAPTMPIAPLLLLLAHGLAGDADGAQSLLDGLSAEDLLEPLLD